METFTRFERWMLRPQWEDIGRPSLDATTGAEDRRVEFRYPEDPRAFWSFLGEQVEPCVFRPSPVYLESLMDGYRRHDCEPDPDTVRIFNVCEAHEGLEDAHTGYRFVLRFAWRCRCVCDCFC